MTSFSPVDLQAALSGADYPANGDQLAERARENGASRTITEELDRLEQEQFDGPAEVSRAVFQED